MSAIATASRWDEVPLGDLIDHIVTVYHQPLPDAMTELERLVGRAFGAAAAGRLAELRELLLEHTRREEELVFPWLRGRRACGAGLVVNLLEQEHGDTVRRVRALRDLVDGRAATEARSVRALSTRLRELEVALGDHLYLENHVLFPRALAAAAAHD